MFRKKNIYKILSVLFILTFSNLFSFYYYNDFTSALSIEWVTNIHYGQSGLFTNYNNLVETSVIKVTNNRLQFSGSPHIEASNVDINEFNGTWIGNGIMLTNEYSATAEQPFGFDIKRVNAAYAPRNKFQDRFQVENSIWLIQQETLFAEWQKYINFFMIFDNAQNTAGTNTRFGTYQGNLLLSPLSNVVDNRNKEWDISSNYGGDQSVNTPYSVTYSLTNTNHYIFRITHDGQTIRTYINPDPDDNDISLPNEFCLINKQSVSWHSNMVIYLNHESRGRLCYAYSEYDYITVRSVASGSSGILLPGERNGDYIFKSFVRVEKNDSGFNTVTMTFSGNPHLRQMPLIKINGKSVNVLNNGKELNYDMLNNSYKEGEINALCLIRENKVTFIFNKFIKSSVKYNPIVNLAIIFSPTIEWISAFEMKVFLDGKQYDRLKWSHGNGATTGKQQISGQFVLSDLSVVLNDK